METNTDVLIVGAGPTGLMLANQLTRRGVRVAIIERHAGPSLQTRALGVHARTLEIYAKLGIADRAIELGKRGNGAHLWSEVEAGGPIQDLFQALDDTRFNLLSFGDAAPKLPDLCGMLRVHAIPITADNEAEQARVRIPRSAIYLLRPDGHIGLCGGGVDADAVLSYLASVVKESAC